MHKPLSWHPLTLKEKSFKLVSVRNMTSTLVRRWARESHFMFVCTLINIHYNSILYSKFYFLSNLTTTTLEKRKIEMQRNLWSKILLTKEKNAMTRSKEIIYHSRLTKQQNQRAKLKWFSICFSLTIWPIVQPSSHTFGSASYTGFLTEERRKEKGALFMKVMSVLIVHRKNKCQQDTTPAKGYTITA